MKYKKIIIIILFVILFIPITILLAQVIGFFTYPSTISGYMDKYLQLMHTVFPFLIS
jgi:hypothetical protein